MGNIVNLELWRQKQQPIKYNENDGNSDRINIVSPAIVAFLQSIGDHGLDPNDPELLLDCERIMDLMNASLNRLRGEEDHNVQVLDALRE